MAEQRIGYKRLYRVLGCEMDDGNEEHIAFDFDVGVHAEVYIGPQPPAGIRIHKGDRFFVPGHRAVLDEPEIYSHARETKYPLSLFLEIRCTDMILIEDALQEEFMRDEEPARSAVLNIAEERAGPLRSATDVIAGTIGLRWHAQFVLDYLNEDIFAYQAGGPAMQYRAGSLQILDHIRVTRRGIAEVRQWLSDEIAMASAETIEHGGNVLNWVMRAWAEPDRVFRFWAMFTPLEIVVRAVEMPIDPAQRARRKRVRRLIRRYGDSGRQAMLHHFDRAMERQRSSLEEHFNVIAEEAQLPGWEDDKVAFAKLNDIRNGLIHRGDLSLRPSRKRNTVTSDHDDEPTGSDLLRLEQLVERYASYSLFQTDAIYPKRLEEAPGVTSNDAPPQEKTDIE